MNKNEQKSECQTITLSKLRSLVVSLDRYPNMSNECINEILTTYFDAKKQAKDISDNLIINIENKKNFTKFLNQQENQKEKLKKLIKSRTI